MMAKQIAYGIYLNAAETQDTITRQTDATLRYRTTRSSVGITGLFKETIGLADLVDLRSCECTTIKLLALPQSAVHRRSIQNGGGTCKVWKALKSMTSDEKKWRLVTDYGIGRYKCGAEAGDIVRLRNDLPITQVGDDNVIETIPKGT